MPSSIEIQPSKPTLGEDAEDRVVVVQPLAGLAVLQLVGVAGGAVGRSQVVERRARREIAIRRVHRHDAVLDLLEERDRIEAADRRVRRVVLHAEVMATRCGSMISRKMSSGCANSGIPPGAVLVVVLHAEDHAAPLGVVERARDAFDGARDAVGARHLRDSAGRSASGSAAPPSRSVRSMAAFCRSTCRARSSASGCVKSGEKQSSDDGCPVSASACDDRVDVLAARTIGRSRRSARCLRRRATAPRESTRRSRASRRRSRRTSTWGRRRCGDGHEQESGYRLRLLADRLQAEPRAESRRPAVWPVAAAERHHVPARRSGTARGPARCR